MDRNKKPLGKSPQTNVSVPARSTRPQGVIWPSDLECFYGISPPTRWRWERDGKLPARNVHVGGGGWLADTLPDVARWLAAHA